MGQGLGSGGAPDMASLAALLGVAGQPQQMPGGGAAYKGTSGLPGAAGGNTAQFAPSPFIRPPASYDAYGGPVKVGDQEWGRSGDRQLRYTPQGGSIAPTGTGSFGKGTAPISFDNLAAIIEAGKAQAEAAKGTPYTGQVQTPDQYQKAPASTPLGNVQAQVGGDKAVGGASPYTDNVWSKLPAGETPGSYAIKLGVPQDQVSVFLTQAYGVPGSTPDEVIGNWLNAQKQAPGAGWDEVQPTAHSGGR